MTLGRIMAVNDRDREVAATRLVTLSLAACPPSWPFIPVGPPLAATSHVTRPNHVVWQAPRGRSHCADSISAPSGTFPSGQPISVHQTRGCAPVALEASQSALRTGVKVRICCGGYHVLTGEHGGEDWWSGQWLGEVSAGDRGKVMCWLDKWLRVGGREWG